MSDTVSLTELDEQHVELLPARTVLSMFGATQGGIGGGALGSTDSTGTTSVTVLGVPVIPGNSNAFGGAGSSANG